MLRNTLIVLLACFSISSYAEEASAQAQESDKPSEMSKDSWLSNITPILPDLICKGFMEDADLKKRFDELKMTYEQCISYIPASSSKCQDELYASMPDIINNQNVSHWGQALGECIGKDFAQKHLLDKQEATDTKPAKK